MKAKSAIVHVQAFMGGKGNESQDVVKDILNDINNLGIDDVECEICTEHMIDLAFEVDGEQLEKPEWFNILLSYSNYGLRMQYECV